MKPATLIQYTAAVLMAFGTSGHLLAADETTPAKRPAREEIREQLKDLPPAEREAKIKELREKYGPAYREEIEKRREEFQNLSPGEREARLKELRERRKLPSREEMEKRREELRNLPPEEREARIKELRENRGVRPGFGGISPEDRAAKRKEVKERLDKQLAELRKKKADGALSEVEQKRLQRMEEVAKRFEQGNLPGARLDLPGRGPGARPGIPPGDK